MGEVFLADDLKLDRPVALKVLPRHFTEDEERVTRFTQEARAVSRLNHPNILTIYEVGTAEGSHYIATEYIAGETLRERLARGPLSLDEIVGVALQACGALAAAHAVGIIHRDIKPENLMVRTDGYVKVLDFGLAKLSAPDGGDTRPDAATVVNFETTPGILMGTVLYMSPEQARGLRLDARTDVWSLGVVLYELAGGRPPFTGQTTTDTIVSILEREPPPLAVPADFARIMAKALAKNLDERYQTIDEMTADLRALKQQLDSGTRYQGPFLTTPLETTRLPDLTLPPAVTNPPRAETGSVTRPARRLPLLVALVLLALTAGALAYYAFLFSSTDEIDSVAVLPFTDPKNDPEAEYLSEGIAESIINSLSQVPRLRVISRSSSFRFKGAQEDVRTVARELGVSAILTGRVAQQGDSVTVSAELVRATDGSQIWGQRYQRKTSDLPFLQEEIARSITERLRGTLSGEERARLNKRSTENAAAYQEYLKGRYYWNKRTAAGLQASTEHYTAAIGLDARFPLPYAGLADTYALLGSYGAVPPRIAMPLAKENAERALVLDPALAEALTARAYVKLYYDWDWNGAEDDFRRALQLNPNYVTAHQWYADYLTIRGRHAEAVTQARRAVETDPLSLAAVGSVGLHYYFNEQYEEAVRAYRRALELDPDFAPASFALGLALERQGRISESLTELNRALTLFGGDPQVEAALGHAYAVSGDRARAETILARLQQLKQTNQRYVSAYALAVLAAGLGRKEEVFASLERAYEEKAVYLPYLKVDPMLKEYRGEARFQNLLHRLNLNQ